MKKTRTCAECGQPLEATLRVYLKDVEMNEDGTISDFTPAVALNGVEYVGRDFEEVLCEVAAGAEGDELDVYCGNDHKFGADDADDEPHEDSPSLEDTTFDHADPRNR